MPANTGAITQWQTYTAGDIAGSSLTFAVLQPAGGGNYTVVGADTETLPNPLPANNVASFTLATPIQVAAGDTLALYSDNGDNCYFQGGSTPSDDSVNGWVTAPSPGQTLGADTSIPGGSASVVNVAVTTAPVEDAGVQTSTFPASTAPGSAAVLSSTVTNHGPDGAPITFTDQVPSGLQIESAAAGLGTCSVSGQTVSCTISGLAVGQSVPVNVVVAPSAPGNYVNDVSVAVVAGAIDPNSANNTASATLSVAAPATPSGGTSGASGNSGTVGISGTAVTASAASMQRCIVPRLRDTRPGIARTVLRDLGCKVRLRYKHSGIRKGLVIGARSGAGTDAYQQLITLSVSSGPKKHK